MTGRATAGGALALLAALHVMIAWFPFRLDLPGRVTAEVERLADGSLDLGGRRIVAETAPPWAGEDVRAVDSVTVELEVLPAATLQVGPARILAVSDGHRAANLMIGQERDHLVVRVRHEASDAAGIPGLVVDRTFRDGGWVHILVEVGPETVDVTVDGALSWSLPVAGPPVRTWDGSYPVVLGDERTGGRVWNGTVRHAVVRAGDRSVDLLAPGVLEVAGEAWYVPARLYEALSPPDRRARLRSLLHLFGFVPVGMLLAAAGAGRGGRAGGLLRVVGVSAGFALVLQLVKIVMDARHPSLLTVAAQATGALGGAALVVLLRWRRALRGRSS